MFVYLVTITELTLPVRSFVAGVYATRELAEESASYICKVIPEDVISSVTETEVIGAPAMSNTDVIRDKVKDHVDDAWCAEIDQLCYMGPEYTGIVSTEQSDRPYSQFYDDEIF